MKLPGWKHDENDERLSKLSTGPKPHLYSFKPFSVEPRQTPRLLLPEPIRRVLKLHLFLHIDLL
jgi:hypothetical protein